MMFSNDVNVIMICLSYNTISIIHLVVIMPEIFGHSLECLASNKIF